MLNLMKLERRIVLDGAAVAGLVDHDAADNDAVAGETSYIPADMEAASVAEAAALLSDPGSNADTDAESLEVVLVSDALPDYQQLVDAAHPNAKVIVYDAGSESAADVLGQVTQLSEEEGRPIDSLSVLSHGGNGNFKLGNEIIFTENLNAYAKEWAELDNAFSEDAKIYLFGCKVASASDSLVDSLAKATGADVYASDDITGAAGDWDLETESEGSEGDADLPFDMEKLAAYDGSLFTDNFEIQITTMEDEPGLFGIYVWGSDVGAGNMPNIQFVNMDQNVSTAGNPLLQPMDDSNLSPGQWIDNNPIMIEGQTIGQYWRWTVEYQPEEDQFGGAARLHFTVNGTPQTAYVTILPVNDPPVAEDLHLTTPEDTPIGGDVEGTDLEDTPDQLQFQIETHPSNGTITNWDPATGNFTYTPNPDYNGTDTFTFTVIDTGGLTDTGTVTITIDPVPDPPDVIPSDGQMCYYENSAPKPVDSGIVVQDIDSSHLSGAVVQISHNYQDDSRGTDYLRYEDMNGITGTYNESTATLTLTGSATTQAYQQALRSVSFEHIGDNPIEGVRTVTFTVTDDTGLVAAGSREVFVDAINDAPEMGPEADDPIEYDSLYDDAVVITDNLDIADIDDERMTRAVVQITENYQMGADVLGFNNTAGITGTWNADTGTLTLAGSATIAQYEAALRSVTYSNTAENPAEGIRRITFTVTDANSRGDGTGICADAPAGGPMDSGVDTEVFVREIVVVVDHPPNLTVNDYMCYPENYGTMFLDPELVLQDTDNSNIVSAVLQIEPGAYQNGEDVLHFAGTDRITGSFDAATGTLTMTTLPGVTASTADFQQALRLVSYENIAGDNPTEGDRFVNFAVTDDTGLIGNGRMRIFVDAVNDAPQFNTLTIDWEYEPGDGQATIASSLQITDVDDTQMSGAVIQISPETYMQGEDVLHFTDAGNITGEWNESTGTLTLTGTATSEDYQTAIQSVTYENLNEVPTESVRLISLTVTDANSGGDGSIVCANTPASEGLGGPLSVTAESRPDVGEKEINKDPGDAPTPLGPPGPDPATPTEGDGPDDVLDAGRYDRGMPGESPGPEVRGGLDRSGPSPPAPIPEICSIDHALQKHLGCRFAKADNNDSKLGSVRWSDLGWTRPLLDEEYDLFTKMFVREAGDKGFNIELGALAQLGGVSEPGQVFAPSSAEDFNDMEAGELRKAFFQNKPKEWDKTQRGWPGERI